MTGTDDFPPAAQRRISGFPAGIELTEIAARASVSAFSRTDAERIEHVLISIRRTLAQLEKLGPVDEELLEVNPTAGLVIERILANLLDLIVDVNTAVGQGFGARPSAGFTESCEAAIAVGLIDHVLAEELRPVEGPHHVVLQLCLDSDPGQAEAVVVRAVSAFQDFERRAIAWHGQLGRE
ncbi:hypothetical protein [Gordonia insulae]|nr:hypothetical protein [Gordonia insulae]